MLDIRQRRAHKLRNASHALLLVGGLTIVTAFSAWLLWSWPGVIITLVSILGLFPIRSARSARDGDAHVRRAPS